MSSPSRESVSRRRSNHDAPEERPARWPARTAMTAAGSGPRGSTRHGQPSSGQPSTERTSPNATRSSGADGEHDEAPEDRGVHPARRRITEHPDLDDGVPHQRPGAGLAVVRDRRRAGHARRRADGAPSGARTASRRRGTVPERADRAARAPSAHPSGRRAAPASLGSGWVWVRPASVSSAWASSGSTAASDSRAPRGLPGSGDDERRAPGTGE